jgi:2-polyprenyl-6-methoxyphenol hydroxylase-like FAD-dependent oxidoreductase
MARRAAVIGAGIGGLATAVALGRRGWRVTVYERRPTLAALGAGLLVWPNAVHAVRALGLGQRLAAIGTEQTVSGVRRADGRWLTRVDPAEIGRRLDAPLLAVARPDLHEVLISGLADTVEIRTGAEVDPGDLPEADLVVAADGVGSATRAALAPGTRVVDAGYVAWRAMVPTARVPAGVVAAETLGAGQRFGCAPITGHGVYWYATAPPPVRTSPPDDQLSELRERFIGWHDPIGALIAATEPADLLHHGVGYLDPVPPLAFDRVALLGDAAHAMTPDIGQGAGLALEDAVTLASTLDGGDVAAGLARYDALRRPRVTALVRRARSIARLLQAAGPVGVLLRDLLIAATPARVTVAAGVRAADWRPPR